MKEKTNYNSPFGISWNELRKELFTPEENAECDLIANIMNEIIKLKHEKNLSIKEIGKICGVRKRVVKKMEIGDIDIAVEDVNKVLAVSGKTLAVVSIENTNYSDNKEKIKYYMSLPYTHIIQERNDDTGHYFYGKILELDGCQSTGSTIEELYENLMEAMESYIELKLERNLPIPEPSFKL